MTRYKLGKVEFAQETAPLDLPPPPPRAAPPDPTETPAAPTTSRSKPPAIEPASVVPPPPARAPVSTSTAAPAPEIEVRPRVSRRSAQRPTTATFVMEPRHRDQIRDGASEAGLYQWAWLSRVLLEGCATVNEPVARPRPEGPGLRPTLIHYTVNLSAEARDTLEATARRWSRGDKSLMVRTLLGRQAGA